MASREGAAEGPPLLKLRMGNGVWGTPKQSKARYGVKIPPRPSVPPERLVVSHVEPSGCGQFRSKNVRAELYNSTRIELKGFEVVRGDTLFGYI